MSNPGLDPIQLRALLRPIRDLGAITDRIRTHIEENDGYLSFSGGKDSLVVLDLARRVEPNIPVVFFDSGLEFPETYQYLAQLQDQWHLNLTVFPARPSLVEVLATNGSWHHKSASAPTPDLHQTLITEPSRRAHCRYGPGELWGVRSSESIGRRAAYSRALPNCPCCIDANQRAALHGGRIARADGTVALGPIWSWSTTEVWGFIANRQLPVNPVYGKLRRLGAGERALRISHVIDGGLLEAGRVVWLKQGWPDLYERIRQVLPRISEYL